MTTGRTNFYKLYTCWEATCTYYVHTHYVYILYVCIQREPIVSTLLYRAHRTDG